MQSTQIVQQDSVDTTQLLNDMNNGHPNAMQHLMDAVYQELKGMACGLFASESANLTLNPTALVHEVFLRFVNTNRFQAQNRAQFFWFAGRLMRRILVDYARMKQTEKRGAGEAILSLDLIQTTAARDGLSPATMIALDEAINDLKDLDARGAHIVEMRFFAGLNLVETGALLGLSKTTVKREWQAAKAWLAARLRAASIS